MAIFSALAGAIGQQGAQSGGDMAWNAALQGRQDAQRAAEIAADQARKNRALSSPWTGSGESALGQITKLLGLGNLTQEGNTDGIHWVKPFGSPDEARSAANDAFVKSPGYQFRQEEGTKALDRSAASRGMTLSGAQTKATQTFGQNIASEEYGNYFNQLMGLAGLGGQAQQGTQGANSSLAGVGANALVSGGNMLAQGGAARGSAYSSGANMLASGIGRGVQNAMFAGTLWGGGFGGGRTNPDAGRGGYGSDYRLGHM